jgi:hypothetical protein
MSLAVITSVDEPILTLIVEFVQHGHRRELGPPEGRELVVLVSGQSQKGITPIHQITCLHGVWVLDALKKSTGNNGSFSILLSLTRILA